jgi:hypothetical protein
METDGTSGYEEARGRARAMGFEYFENEQLLLQPAEARLQRLEALFRMVRRMTKGRAPPFWDSKKASLHCVRNFPRI